MNPNSGQFRICDSCNRVITGEANVLRADSSGDFTQYFHKNPEDCSKASGDPSLKTGMVGHRKRSRTAIDWKYE